MKKASQLTLGEWITQKREAENLTGRRLAKKIGISHTTLADIENGIPASVNACKIIARYYGITQAEALYMNGTIDDELDISEAPDIAATVLVMKNMNRSLQKDIKEYAFHKQRLAERSEGNDKNPQKTGAD